MNNEIKEILNYLAFLEDIDTQKKVKKVADYITNLQQKLEEYKDTETYSKRFLYKANKDRLNANLDLVKENERLKLELSGYREAILRDDKLLGLQQRIEKAVEYIKRNCITSDTWEDLGFCNLVPTGNIKYKSLSAKKVKEVIDILNGKE